ncbi:MAG: cyclic nucleotide-binding/CBS domain-containing protein [Nitrospirae bacterium]|nr:MAG: cyclic nucleotide-binding/CBS domain-containing protein [Nitrospirota bacterium]
MILDCVTDFFRNTPPFKFLDEDTLKNIAGSAGLEFYPAGQTILYQNGPPAASLYLIKSGGVKIFVKTSEDEEALIDYRSDGDFFGLLSLLSGDVSKDNVVAAEDTSCYLLNKDLMVDLIETNAQCAFFYLKYFLGKFTDFTYPELANRSLLYGGGDKLLFTNTLGDLASKEVITAFMDISIQEAAKKMATHKISALVLVDADGLPAGIVTDRDLREKVVAKGRSLADPAGSIMSVTLIKSEARDYCFEALLKMIKYNIHHLLVVNKGEIRGIITNHDLMMLQGTSPLTIAREIEGQDTIDGLVPVARKINRIITLLVKESAKAGNITRIITEINDRLLRKALDIAERRFGPPPVNYCWIVFGSEGRKEQTFKTDQDNAIIYEDPKEGGQENAKKYFSEFAQYMKDVLVKCGFPVCPANYMASNDMWCQPLSVWRGYFSSWIDKPTPEAVLFSLIFFDFRPIHGNFMLAERLRAHLGYTLKDRKIFLASMAREILRNNPPLDFFGRFITEKRGGHKGKINIKINGLSPIVDIVRLLSLEAGLYNTTTVERLQELRSRHEIIRSAGDELAEAFEFLMSLRLRHQFDQIQSKSEPDNFINPDGLSRIEKKTLKETFKLIARTQEGIREQYHALL